MTKPGKKKPAKADVSDGSFADVPAATGKLPEPDERREAAIAHATARIGKRRKRLYAEPTMTFRLPRKNRNSGAKNCRL